MMKPIVRYGFVEHVNLNVRLLCWLDPATKFYLNCNLLIEGMVFPGKAHY